MLAGNIFLFLEKDSSVSKTIIEWILDYNDDNNDSNNNGNNNVLSAKQQIVPLSLSIFSPVISTNTLKW